MPTMPDPTTSDGSVDDGAGDRAGPATALASVRARVIAFASIIVAGLLGAGVGNRVAAVACDTGSCDGAVALSMVAGTIVGALGIAVVAVITLRAAREWRGGA